MNTITIINILKSSLAAILVMGCSSPNQYQIKGVQQGELTWAYSNSLEVEKNGKLVTSEKRKWEGLAQSTACVSESAKLGASASKNSRLGSALSGTGYTIMFTTLIGGIAMMLTGALRDHDSGTGLQDPLFWGGMGTMIGGPFAIGLPIAAGGNKRYLQGKADAFDAFYIYNDSYQNTPACGYVQPTPAPAPTIAPPPATIQAPAPTPAAEFLPTTEPVSMVQPIPETESPEVDAEVEAEASLPPTDSADIAGSVPSDETEPEGEPSTPE